MRFLMGASLCVLLPLAASGCDGGCTKNLVFGLVVRVAFRGTLVCDATVTAQEGSHVETLQPFGSPSDCLYQGAGERAGDYTITAVRDSLMGVATATVEGGECHVTPEQVFITLE